MELQEILTRFAQYTGLAGAALEEQEPLCAAAMAELEHRRNQRPLTQGGKDLLHAAAAAMACRRHLLLCVTAGGSLTVGDARVGEGGPVQTAQALEAEALAAASPWLRPEVVFRRTEGWDGL